jgi:hypothetical protein
MSFRRLIIPVFYIFCFSIYGQESKTTYIIDSLRITYNLPRTDTFSNDTSDALDFALNYEFGNEPRCLTYQAMPASVDSSNAKSWVQNFLTGNIDLSALEPQIEFYKNSFKYPYCEKELAEFRNFFKWIKKYSKGDFVWVNIPSQELYVFQDSKFKYKMNVIVGTYKNQTPIFADYIDNFSLFPYWYPTQNIVFDEIIPKTIADIGFLERNFYEVLDKKGKMVDPLTLEWETFKRDKFPYRIRQTTGCFNSLGLIKFNLKNPFSIYLHDTQHTQTSRGLFKKSKRYYSHGCIRIEKPKEFLSFLKPAKPVDPDFMVDCPTDKKPITIPLKEKMPVFVMYFTDFINEKGQLISKPDFYKLLH